MQTAGRWILRNTKICIDHMTPEIKLRLITAECPMWTQQPESCPYPDPYWAFYWPGGQTLTRFILDQRNLVEGKVCLDFGSGCGSAGIASAMTGAKKVIFNDIDQTLLSSCLNSRLNGLPKDKFTYLQTDLISIDGQSANSFDFGTILIGDLFYDSDFSKKLIDKLLLWADSGKEILIGDPGRYTLPSFMNLIAEYPLPSYITREHYGFSTGKVYSISK